MDVVDSLPTSTAVVGQKKGKSKSSHKQPSVIKTEREMSSDGDDSMSDDDNEPRLVSTKVKQEDSEDAAASTKKRRKRKRKASAAATAEGGKASSAAASAASSSSAAAAATPVKRVKDEDDREDESSDSEDKDDTRQASKSKENRASGEDGAGTEKKKRRRRKKRKGANGDAVDGEDGAGDDDDVERDNQRSTNKKRDATKSESTQGRHKGKVGGHGRVEEKKRFVLFVGNLDYRTTKDDLFKHFGGEKKGVTQVRITTDKVTNKPKGFAFMEFDSADSLQTALKKHHSVLAKRKINVELTAGGGGTKSATRKAKLTEKNKKLEQEREEINKARKEKEQQATRQSLAALHTDAQSSNPHNRPAAAMETNTDSSDE